MALLLDKQVSAKVQEIAEKYNLELLLLFGSRVSGKVHKESDYDVGYMSQRKLDLDDEGRLINDLISIVGAQDERAVNLVNIRKAKPLLLYAMTSKCQVLYERDPATFARLRAYAFKQYIETRPLYEEKARRLQKAFNV